MVSVARFSGQAFRPVIRRARLAQDEADDGREGGFGADVVGQQHDAAFSAFDADPAVAGGVVMPAFFEPAALRPGEGDHAEPGGEIGAALGFGQFRLQRRELATGGDRHLRTADLRARFLRQALATGEGGGEAGEVGDRRVHPHKARLIRVIGKR